MKSWVEAAYGSLRALRDFLFPRECCVCGCALSEDENDICNSCLEDLPLTYFWDWFQNPAFERMVRFAPVEASASLFFFRDEAGYSHIPHSIKYLNRKELGRRMGRLLGEKLASGKSFSNGTFDAVVPVPLHWSRQWKRGYNQAEIISEGISAVLGAPVIPNLLLRIRHTRTQTRLSGRAKGRNVSGAFRLNADIARTLKKRAEILLVDDVLTTGATLGECAKMLVEAGFKVRTATLAFVGNI